MVHIPDLSFVGLEFCGMYQQRMQSEEWTKYVPTANYRGRAVCTRSFQLEVIRWMDDRTREAMVWAVVVYEGVKLSIKC